MNSIYRKMRSALHRAIGYYSITIGEHRFRVDPDHIKYWSRVEADRWEPETFEVLSKYLEEDMVYADIGAWIGPTVLAASKICSKVVAFEPDPVAYRYLLWNIELNNLTNVICCNTAIRERSGIMRISSYGKKLGNSTSSFLEAESRNAGVDVMASTLKQWQNVTGIERLDFIKIDIEGGEFSLLPAICDYIEKNRPILYLSTHAPRLESSNRRAMMASIISPLQGYKRCLDEGFSDVSVEELISERSLNEYREFLFLMD